MPAPKTIEELKQWAEVHNLPLDQMRTYIGKDVRSPKCFGIYQDAFTGEFVVYKNKADGTRSIRYQGPDEAYAVNELYVKMKERLDTQRSVRAYKQSVKKRRRLFWNSLFFQLFTGIVLIPGITFTIIALTSERPRRPELPYADTGYYEIDGRAYYHRGSGDWYGYNGLTWYEYYPDADWILFDDYQGYYEGYSYQDYDFDGWYDDQQSYDYYDDDDDYDWDSGWDWDDSYDDWDSDW